MKKTDFIKEILLKKKERIILAKQTLSEEELKVKVQGMPPARPALWTDSAPAATYSAAYSAIP